MLFRSEFGDTIDPHFWSEAELLVYLNEAHRQFVRGIGGIPDIITVAYTADEAFSGVPPTLLKVVRAYHPDDGEPITARNIEELDTTSELYRSDNRRYRPLELLLGLKQDQVRWLPIPSESGSVELAVNRKTTLEVTESTIETAVFEIEEQYHRALVYGVASQALLKHDVEVFDKEKAEDLAARFYSEIAAAKADRSMREHNPRGVQYAGPDIGGSSGW